jgi:membrane associated rhomboid family serine protease
MGVREAQDPVLIPLRDHNPRRRFPVLTVVLIVVNALVYLAQLSLPEAGVKRLVLAAGAVPREIITLQDFPPEALLPLPLTLFSSMFLHGGLLHLAGNMWFLWLFGDNVEDRMGRLRYGLFYFLTGTVGALAQCLMMPGSLVPMIGASGAIAGVLGGYILTFPQARIDTFVALPFLWHVRAIPAWIFLGLWFLGQFLISSASGIAWMAHVGGFLAGVGMVRLFVPRGRPEAVESEYFPPLGPG